MRYFSSSITINRVCAFCLPALLSLLFVACKQTDAPPYKPTAIDYNPIATYLSPEESMKTMHLPEGYHLQLVASEPMIQEPVAVVWDANGRMYVAEMRSYMMDVNGTGEHYPICRVSMLEDTNGDGRMDKSSIFIDSLVLPRMMLSVGDKLIVNETYSFNMYAYRDTNGDGKADEKTLVYHNDTIDNANLEHQKSGLVWNIDNRIYVTYSPVRYTYENGMMKADSMSDSPGGQWGLANDDYGHLFYSSAGGEQPVVNFQQNPVYGQLDFNDQRIDSFDAVWPIIATPDVQGGQERLRPDSTLNHFTASCGQTVYRGDKMPESTRGDLFVCEPVGRLIRRAKVLDKNGESLVKNAYDHAEFLTSSDMNFRPVNTFTGPDGCMYIVDMYHGIIQESAWTKADSYLRPQILRKNLDKNIGRGRIYRIVHDGYTPGTKPALLHASNNDLVKALSNTNGWWRDNAEKLMVMHQDKSVVPALEALVPDDNSLMDKLAFWKAKKPLATRVQALWTLDGLHAVNRNLLVKMYDDPAPEMRKAAIRISEQYLAQGDTALLQQMEHLKTDTSAGVRVQLALSLRYSKSAQAKALLNQLAAKDKGNQFIQSAITGSLQEGDEALNQLKESIAGMPWRDRRNILDGAINFKQLCATCHGPDGKGLPSAVAPPLSGSAEVNGRSDLLIRILLNGLKGPIHGKTYADQMMAQGANDDDYIASTLSFIRISLGNKAGMVGRDEVRKIRKEIGSRNTPWTLDELAKIPAETPEKK